MNICLSILPIHNRIHHDTWNLTWQLMSTVLAHRLLWVGWKGPSNNYMNRCVIRVVSGDFQRILKVLS